MNSADINVIHHHHTLPPPRVQHCHRGFDIKDWPNLGAICNFSYAPYQII